MGPVGKEVGRAGGDSPKRCWWDGRKDGRHGMGDVRSCEGDGRYNEEDGCRSEGVSTGGVSTPAWLAEEE